MGKMISVEEKWFLLKTKTRQEKRAMENLEGKMLIVIVLRFL